MHNPKSDLERANALLKILQSENIDSSNQGGDFSKKLNLARSLTLQLAQESGKIGPALTACVATTLLKIGLCQELAQRFALEYCIKYKEKNISIIFLSNPSGQKKEDHAFVCFGSIKAPDELFIGKGNANVTIAPEKTNQSLTDFLKINNNVVFGDLLLNFAGTSQEETAPLLEYCKKYNITHVVGIRSYATTPNFIENAPIIKKNAIEVAEKVKQLTKGTVEWGNYEIKNKEILEPNKKPEKERESKLKKGFFSTPSKTDAKKNEKVAQASTSSSKISVSEENTIPSLKSPNEILSSNKTSVKENKSGLRKGFFNTALKADAQKSDEAILIRISDPKQNNTDKKEESKTLEFP